MLQVARAASFNQMLFGDQAPSGYVSGIAKSLLSVSVSSLFPYPLLYYQSFFNRKKCSHAALSDKDAKGHLTMIFNVSNANFMQLSVFEHKTDRRMLRDDPLSKDNYCRMTKL